MAKSGAVSRARILRRALTPPEARLWIRLRRRALGELKFRRQHPVGVYVLDFYCPEAKLAVEIDGESHAERAEHDAHRTRWLETRGIAVVRFTAEAVRVNLDAVLDFIALTARDRVRG
ncbi:endonuclease domain-containing protein [Brevundimonas sp.]|jgi:very-short-patch-repair endonuclease|uniref:endonuclease domain-containing protein n=1 Tax=Brevundimonas sp. TaxID=1871086 RepID=UPI0037BFE691